MTERERERGTEYMRIFIYLCVKEKETKYTHLFICA